ncbi:MAG: aminotransferase class IV [Dehalococcoidaceae bacterium]|nr:aminotransferase class IV [Dehalococcoidaceae bacterium]
MSETVYLNGAFIPAVDARIHVSDAGFLYGYGLFETMRANEGSIFRLDRHLERLAGSAGALGIELDTGQLSPAVMETIRINDLNSARIRITVTAGTDFSPEQYRSGQQANILITARQYEPLPPEIYRRGYSAIISSMVRCSRSPASTLKTTSYLQNLLAKREALLSGVDEAIFLNEEDNVCEGSITNLFILSGNTLITPAVSCGILAGITREAVLELAGKLGIAALEAQFPAGEISEAGEAFLTNSVIGLMPLVSLGGKPVGNGKPGKITTRLASAYNSMVTNYA